MERELLTIQLLASTLPSLYKLLRNDSNMLLLQRIGADWEEMAQRSKEGNVRTRSRISCLVNAPLSGLS